jgi:hypothetical protein
MRKPVLILAAAGAIGAFALPAQAGALGGADSVLAARDATQLAEPVHCRPGRAHHSSFRYPDGCERHSYYRYRTYAYPYTYGYPYAYGAYPYGYYSPGVSFSFGYGPRYGWHW